MEKTMKRPPLLKMLPCWGMPSPLICFTALSLTTSPTGLVNFKTLPSRWVIVRVKPVSASVREMLIFITRSAPLRWKVSCSFTVTTIITSPGSVPGTSSASPPKRTFCPWLMPRSTCTSNTFLSLSTLLPMHTLHLSFSFMHLPAPRHPPHTDCTCCTIPGPIWRSWMRAPRPLQSEQVLSAPILPPLPSQSWQGFLREIASLTVLPLYRSSRETFIWCTMSSPLGTPLRPPPPPPPPKNMENTSSADCPPPPPPPPSRPSMPCASYVRRLSASHRISAAALISLNFSISPPLSGWFFSASFL
mmetsp:Transcript_32680/g.71921  ORF Transcript_32680/g.71921 Transcript_32680/m.71921 type:complete len:303 (-) Transcript_32680:274-1182(-)